MSHELVRKNVQITEVPSHFTQKLRPEKNQSPPTNFIVGKRAFKTFAAKAETNTSQGGSIQEQWNLDHSKQPTNGYKSPNSKKTNPFQSS